MNNIDSIIKFINVSYNDEEAETNDVSRGIVRYKFGSLNSEEIDKKIKEWIQLGVEKFIEEEV